MKTRVLLTGASGFIGRRILEGLAGEGDLTLSILLRDPDKAEDLVKDASLEIHKGDITRPESLKAALSGKAVIIHCAALMSNFDSETHAGFYKVNVTGTRNLLKSCDLNTLKQFIHISTVGVYGACGKEPLDEEAPYGSALSTYEWSKKESELAVLKYAKERNIPFTILRPSPMYGVGMSYGWPDTIKAINSGKMLIPGNGKAKIHLLNVGDLVRAIKLALLNKSAINKIYNIAGPEILNLAKVFDTISEIMGAKRPGKLPFLPVYFASVFLNFIPAGLKGGKLALLTPHRISFFSKNHFYDISKARRELNYEPCVNMREGFGRMINWCRRKGLA
jgi:nucleoside-diphosphate-sugar epimerase